MHKMVIVEILIIIGLPYLENIYRLDYIRNVDHLNLYE
jgi:hypothetical protein